MPAILVANLCVLLVFAIGGLLLVVDTDLYYRSSQEDEVLEWVTFWAFLFASIYYLRAARRDRQLRGGLPWFHIGLAAFCLLVALEEISWGQRLLGYRAPELFLARNYQQEFNLHNLADDKLRRALLLLILAGYGVTAALAGLVRPLRGWLERLRFVLPPPGLIPAFGITAVIYAVYPADLTGEWVECAMGLAFLFAARWEPDGASFRPLAVATLLVAGCSVGTALVLDRIRPQDDARAASAKLEIAALVADFDSPRLHTRCGIHKRLYTFMVEYGQPYLRQGEFAQLAEASGAGARAAYLLDPWNSPYWIRHRCDDGRPVAFVYSFGPDRRRDSSDTQIQGDDIGEYLRIKH
ncbi:MAG TPA: hypothetical protein VLB07_14460 [Woeseiaceae bacterium]|nr:hypothetical protein [Woeseiaceae bacterium]